MLKLLHKRMLSKFFLTCNTQGNKNNSEVMIDKFKFDHFSFWQDLSIPWGIYAISTALPNKWQNTLTLKNGGMSIIHF